MRQLSKNEQTEGSLLHPGKPPRSLTEDEDDHETVKKLPHLPSVIVLVLVVVVVLGCFWVAGAKAPSGYFLRSSPLHPGKPP
jgi:hypothetical protein